ncbi:unnamed protein product [Onchocerca flexuosa]|uniref:MSP domain-containing protein n=1 Tax=Onchocerca flexuosa TaxID=387005 RepID=A0A183HBF9_9BILA|nr:unnamed protein product [Onchocerca flexuosa]
MGFMRPGQKKQVILERRPGKPGKTFLFVEYIAAPSGYDPRKPFIEGAEVGQVKILIRAYKDQKIPETVPHLQGKPVTRRGQKFLAPAIIDDEKIEREIEELCAKKDRSQPMFEFDEHLMGEDEEDDDEKKKIVEDKIKRPLSPFQPRKKPIMMSAEDIGGAESMKKIKGQMENLSKEFEAMKFSIKEQQSKTDDKLEKAISDLIYMKFALIVTFILLLFRSLVPHG